MAFLSSINIIGSGLTAQQLRLDVVSENITNSTTTDSSCHCRISNNTYKCNS